MIIERQYAKILTNEILSEYGFEPIPHFTIGNSIIKDLGRGRHLSFSSVGTPNEMLFICEHDVDPSRHEIRDAHAIKNCTKVIVLWNYDYDGNMDEQTLLTLLSTMKWL